MGKLYMARRARGPGPHYVDIHVGRRIRTRRKAIELSMEALATKISVSHQQMQKYETGASRINVTAIYQIAGVLGTSVAYFFDDLPDPGEISALDHRTSMRLEAFLSSPGGADLMAAFAALPPRLQHPLVSMARALVADKAEAETG